MTDLRMRSVVLSPGVMFPSSPFHREKVELNRKEREAVFEIIAAVLLWLVFALEDHFELFENFAPPWLKKIVAVVLVLVSIRLLSMVLEPNPHTTTEIEDIARTAVDVFMFIGFVIFLVGGVFMWFDTSTEEKPSSTEEEPHLVFEIKR